MTEIEKNEDRYKKLESEHHHLRRCIDTELVRPILKEDYYNMACDIYTCDRLVAEDIRKEYEYKSELAKKYSILFNISLGVNIGLVIYFIITSII